MVYKKMLIGHLAMPIIDDVASNNCLVELQGRECRHEHNVRALANRQGADVVQAHDPAGSGFGSMENHGPRHHRPNRGSNGCSGCQTPRVKRSAPTSKRWVHHDRATPTNACCRCGPLVEPGTFPLRFAGPWPIFTRCRSTGTTSSIRWMPCFSVKTNSI